MEKTYTGEREPKKQSGTKTESYLNTLISYHIILPIEGMWENQQEVNIWKAKVCFGIISISFFILFYFFSTLFPFTLKGWDMPSTSFAETTLVLSQKKGK